MIYALIVLAVVIAFQSFVVWQLTKLTGDRGEAAATRVVAVPATSNPFEYLEASPERPLLEGRTPAELTTNKQPVAPHLPIGL